MSIIPYHPDFQREVIEFILSIQREEFGLTLDLAYQPDLLAIEQYYPDSFWLALDEENRLAGCIALVHLADNKVALKKMFVRKDLRNQGLGRRLVDYFLATCRARAVKAIYLGTTDSFQSAQHFYRRLGFSEIEKLDLPNDFPILDVDNRSLSHEHKLIS